MTPEVIGSAPKASELFDAMAAVLDDQRVGLCLYDSERRIVRWNDALSLHFPELDSLLQPGVSVATCLRHHFALHLPATLQATIDQHIEAALERGRKPGEPYQYRCSDGRWLSLEWREVSGEYRLLVVRDGNAKPALDRDHEVQVAFASLDIGFALFSTEGLLISASHGYYQLFAECAKLKRSKATYSGHLACIARHAFVDAEAAQLVALANRDLYSIPAAQEPLLLRHREGHWLAFEERRTQSGGFIALWTDATEQVRAQKTVDTVQARLIDATESIADAFALFDRDNRLVICNSRYQQFTGLKHELLVPGTPWLTIVRDCLDRGLYPAAKGREQQWIDERQAKRQSGAASAEIELDNGMWFLALDRRTREGGTVSIGIDITALKQREAELSRQAAMLNAISYVTASLLGHASWETIIEDLLAKLGQAADVDRVIVFQIDNHDDGRRFQSCRFEWCADGVFEVRNGTNNQNDELTTDDAERRRYIEMRERGIPLQAKVIDLSGYPRQKYDREGVKAIVSAPIMVTDSWWGHINFHDCRRDRVWTELEVGVLKTAARLLAAIVEREHNDSELRASEQRFRSMAETLPIVITSIEQGEVLYVSQPAAEMFGTTAQDLLHTSIRRFHVDATARRRIVATVQRSGYVDDAEVTLRRADGSEFAVTLTCRQTVYNDRAALMTALTDLSVRKKAESEIARQRDALHHADKISALGSLLAGVAHELNNPLSILIGQALLMEGQLAGQPQLTRRAESIRQAAERCGRIVKTFLSMARQRPPEYHDTDLAQIINSVLDLTAYAIRSTDITVHRQIAGALPPLWGDQDQLGQLILNLIINAQQALQESTDPRAIWIVVRVAAEDIVVEVADNGPGIADELKTLVFDDFYTTKPVGVGTGVGLPLCRRIVQRHDGSLTVHDAPQGGALFRVTLPQRMSGAKVQYHPPEQTPAASANAKILIIDDELEIAAMLADILSGDGYELTLAHSGREGLEKLAQADRLFDLVISDVRMPDLDGPSFYRKVIDSYPAMRDRFIFVTGDTLHGPNPMLSELEHAALWVEKPFDPDKIRRLVAKRLNEPQSSSTN